MYDAKNVLLLYLIHNIQPIIALTLNNNTLVEKRQGCATPEILMIQTPKNPLMHLVYHKLKA